MPSTTFVHFVRTQLAADALLVQRLRRVLAHALVPQRGQVDVLAGSPDRRGQADQLRAVRTPLGVVLAQVGV